jgi:hypothetical protein
MFAPCWTGARGADVTIRKKTRKWASAFPCFLCFLASAEWLHSAKFNRNFLVRREYVHTLTSLPVPANFQDKGVKCSDGLLS